MDTVTNLCGVPLVGLSVDCSEWVKAGLISHEDMLDRNWAYWTTFSAVCIKRFVFVNLIYMLPFLGRVLVYLCRSGLLRLITEWSTGDPSSFCGFRI